MRAPLNRSSTVKQDGDQPEVIDRTLFLLQNLMERVKNSTKMQSLHTAIKVLQDFLDKGSFAEESRPIIQWNLFIALLTRFGLLGWIEDLEGCSSLCKNLVVIGANMLRGHYEDQIVHGGFDEVKLSIQLIRDCRNSLDIDTLHDIKCVAEGAVSSLHVKNGVSNLQHANLLILLGKALVMRYLSLKRSNAMILEHAMPRFQEAACLCPSHVPLAYISFASLAHIGWLRFAECRCASALFEMQTCLEETSAIDEEAGELLNKGTQLLAVTPNESQLHQAIEFFTAALRHYKAPHPKRSIALHNLAYALSIRFKQRADPQDLDHCILLNKESLALKPVSHPRRIETLPALTGALMARYGELGTLEDLQDGIILAREELEYSPSPSHERSRNLYNLGQSLLIRFLIQRDKQDLGEAIILLRESLSIPLESFEDHAYPLDYLALALQNRSKETGNSQDLEDSIALHRRALALRPVSHTHYTVILDHLASGLFARFEQMGSPQDLEEAITLHQKALESLTTSHLNHSLTLSSLAQALNARFELIGTFSDLEDSIILLREAVRLIPAQHPTRPVALSELGTALLSRFDHRGVFQNLDECIALLREALTLLPASHPNHHGVLASLGNALVMGSEYVVQGAKDLEESIALLRQALAHCPESHANRGPVVSCLATSLRKHYERTKDTQVLDESIVLCREALRLQPPSHTNHPKALANLAAALADSFGARSSLEHLEESISHLGRALSLQPAPHPFRQQTLSKIARALADRFEYQGDDADLGKALHYHESASRYETGSLLGRFESSRSWAYLARKHRPASALAAYQYAIGLLPLLASLDLTLEQRQDVLVHSQEIGGDAAECAINENRFNMALVFISIGRSIFWAQALQLRTSVDDLAIVKPTLADRFHAICRQLNQSLDPTAGKPQHVQQKPFNRHQIDLTSFQKQCSLTDQRNQVIEEIRQLDGFEEFLMPPTPHSLESVASKFPVVFLNASKFGCDAFVLRGSWADQSYRIRLSTIQVAQAEALKTLFQILLGQRRAMPIHIPLAETDALRTLFPRDMVPKPNTQEDNFRLALEYLWVNIVEPVVRGLNMQKMDSPSRIWWCPTGSFASLPIHAAGIYSNDNQPIDCMFQYAVSSFCTSPLDLLHPAPSLSPDFRMTTIIEPEAPGAAPLPAVLEELEIIRKHTLNQGQLNVHLGLRTAPNNVQDLVSDIQQSSLVHFGCHGMQNIDNPLESYLLLSGGKLTMSKIIKECRVANGALAYLSACETAKGDVVRPDVSLDLATTMIFAGFRGVVGTLWSIYDDDAPVVADIFYGHLFRNGRDTPPDVRDAAYGLHLATKELRALGKPYRSWVPYVHYGI